MKNPSKFNLAKGMEGLPRICQDLQIYKSNILISYQSLNFLGKFQVPNLGETGHAPLMHDEVDVLTLEDIAWEVFHHTKTEGKTRKHSMNFVQSHGDSFLKNWWTGKWT